MKELKPFLVKYKKIITPTVLILLSIFLFFAVITPQISSISETNAQIKEVSDQISTLQASISVVQSANRSKTAEDLSTVTTALPTSKDVVLIFNALSNAAAAANVTLDEFSLKIGGIYGKAEQVDIGGVQGVPTIGVRATTSGSANNMVAFAKKVQEELPLSEVRLLNVTDGTASYDINFFYKPLDLTVLKQEKVAPLSQSDQNTLKKLEEWNN